jgi:acetolactate synthase-1/2/3 large subunit
LNYGGRHRHDLGDSDYAAMARVRRACRARDRSAQLDAAFERAFANAPALVDVVVTQDTLSSDLEKD